MSERDESLDPVRMPEAAGLARESSSRSRVPDFAAAPLALAADSRPRSGRDAHFVRLLARRRRAAR